MGDPKVQNGLNDATLATKVVEAYASGLDALTEEECNNLGINWPRSAVLISVLDKGAGGKVTEDERQVLIMADFSQEFIKRIAGNDGKRALQARARWLGDHCVTRRLYVAAGKDEQLKMIKEIGAIGPAAASAVPALIKVLGDEDSNMSEAAAAALGNIGAPAIPALIKLRDAKRVGSPGSAGARAYFAAHDALGNMSITAAPTLIKLLKDKDPDIREIATMALGNIGPEAAPTTVPALIEVLLKDKDGGMRMAAADALGKIGPKAVHAVPALRGALKDEDGRVRVDAAFALDRIDPAAGLGLPVIIDALNDKDSKVRRVAVSVLVEIGSAAAPAALALTKVLLKDKDWTIRYLAAYALGNIGSAVTPIAVPALIRALEDKHPNVRGVAAGMLGKIGSATREVISALKKMRDADPIEFCREDALEALKRIKGD